MGLVVPFLLFWFLITTSFEGVPFFFVDPAPGTAASKEEIAANKESYAKWEKFFYDNVSKIVVVSASFADVLVKAS